MMVSPWAQQYTWHKQIHMDINLAPQTTLLSQPQVLVFFLKARNSITNSNCQHWSQLRYINWLSLPQWWHSTSNSWHLKHRTLHARHKDGNHAPSIISFSVFKWQYCQRLYWNANVSLSTCFTPTLIWRVIGKILLIKNWVQSRSLPVWFWCI